MTPKSTVSESVGSRQCLSSFVAVSVRQACPRRAGLFRARAAEVSPATLATMPARGRRFRMVTLSPFRRTIACGGAWRSLERVCWGRRRHRAAEPPPPHHRSPDVPSRRRRCSHLATTRTLRRRHSPPRDRHRRQGRRHFPTAWSAVKPRPCMGAAARPTSLLSANHSRRAPFSTSPPNIHHHAANSNRRAGTRQSRHTPLLRSPFPKTGT